MSKSLQDLTPGIISKIAQSHAPEHDLTMDCIGLPSDKDCDSVRMIDPLNLSKGKSGRNVR